MQKIITQKNYLLDTNNFHLFNMQIKTFIQNSSSKRIRNGTVKVRPNFHVQVVRNTIAIKSNSIPIPTTNYGFN